MSKTRTLAVLGGGESGVGAAILAKKQGYSVLVYDNGTIKPQYKERLVEFGIAWKENDTSQASSIEAQLVVKSPGIPSDAELIKALKSKGTPVISEIEFAARHTSSMIIAITGSNGKTTTSSLAHYILSNAGIELNLAGNIGKSFAEKVALEDKPYYILEISSFQLDDCVTFSPHIAVITNITPDHLERYDYSFENYVASKFRIVMNHTEDDYLIYDADDKATVNYIKTHPIKSQLVPFSAHQELGYGIFLKNDKIIINMKSKYLLNAQDISLKGIHNMKNVMAATAISELMKVDREMLKKSLCGFEGVKHRLQRVAAVGNVLFVNDSKATNVNSVFYALESMTQPVIWIVGGVDKGNDYEELIPLVKEKVKAIVCLGVDNSKIVNAFKDKVGYLVETSSMEQAVSLSHRVSESGDCVLLSPACASFDLFKNYEDRGEQFIKAVNNLK